MTFKEIVDDALDRVQYDATATTSGPRTRFKRYVNQWHRRILSDSKFSKLRDSKGTFATVASTAQYGLPPILAKVARIYDATGTNVPLSKRDPDWLRNDPDADVTEGTPIIYVPYGLRPIYRRPSATGIWAVSSDAADTTQTIRIDAVRSGGYPHSPAAQLLTGTSRVQIGSRTDYIDIVRCHLSAACAGDVSLYDASSSGNLLGVIPIGKLVPRYFVIQLYPVPSSVITYTVEGQLAIQDLVQDVDEPMIPEDFHSILSTCCRYEEYKDYKKELETAENILARDLEPQLLNMLDALVNPDSYVPVPETTGRDMASSNLGSWFPAGRW